MRCVLRSKCSSDSAGSASTHGGRCIGALMMEDAVFCGVWIHQTVKACPLRLHIQTQPITAPEMAR
eukprot:241687-Pelagomonas_calceolata.AAC.6